MRSFSFRTEHAYDSIPVKFALMRIIYWSCTTVCWRRAASFALYLFFFFCSALIWPVMTSELITTLPPAICVRRLDF